MNSDILIYQNQDGIEVSISSRNQVGNQVSNQVGNQVTQKKQLDFADLFLLWDMNKPAEKSIRKYTEEAKGLDDSVFWNFANSRKSEKRFWRIA